ncbi:hypothetical protein C2E23DRAFT_801683 [Lenzites betulinus]|nr:hypothetical protein C2E23DRAFT_801683 [Lenzites betulinus]
MPHIRRLYSPGVATPPVGLPSAADARPSPRDCHNPPTAPAPISMLHLPRPPCADTRAIVGSQPGPLTSRSDSCTESRSLTLLLCDRTRGDGTRLAGGRSCTVAQPIEWSESAAGSADSESGSKFELERRGAGSGEHLNCQGWWVSGLQLHPPGV